MTEKAPASGTLYDDFDRRFAAIHPKLMNICRSLVGIDAAEDVVHDTYLRGRSRIHQLRDLARFDAWLTRIAINLCFTWHRSRRRVTGRPNADLSTNSVHQRDTALRELIEDLPPRDRTLIVLHYGYGYTLAEIGQMLGISAGNARVAVFRARARLGEQLRAAAR
ncbi:MAG TPA: RNA polymerase sigma factor [Thermoleophilaceae bacterium]|nr:RNA polymerase sigma factor [Thermoleophilaceae bacterium]